jgi:4-amino-4-deoxy-L-arabinose transferase-like glycosyltransferase
LLRLTKGQRLVFWLILALGIVMRLWLIFAQNDRLITDYDDKMYLQSATRLLDSGMFTFGSHVDKPTVFIPPLFPLYLAGVFAVFGKGAAGLYAARFGVVLMAALSMWLLVRIAHQLQRPSMGLWAAGVMAVYPSLILNNTLYLTETMFAMLTLCFFTSLIAAIESRKRGHLLLAGLFLGLATLARPTSALFPIGVGLYLWCRKDYGFKKAFAVGITLVAMLFVVLSPWIVRNYVQFHQFIPLTKASGNPFLTGTYINNDVWANGPDDEFPDYPKGWKKVPGNQLATDDLLMSIGKERLRAEFKAQPGAMLKWYTYGKFKNFWAYPFDWNDVLKDWYEPLKWFHRVLMLGSFVGLVLAFWRRVPYTGLFALWFCYLTVLQMAYVTTPRYVLPLLPYVFLYFGYFVTGGWRKKSENS